MVTFFRKLPLTYKLIVIGLVPILFLIYFSILIFKEKSERVELISDHIKSVELSADLTELINGLARERRSSYQYKIRKVPHDEIIQYRQKTDSLIKVLANSGDFALKNFTDYTFLDELPAIRSAVDTSHGDPASSIMQFYTDAIARLNTLNPPMPLVHTFLRPVYQDLIVQRILSEMCLLLATMRTNVFDALYTGSLTDQALSSTQNTYKAYISYEKEFLLKASPQTAQLYKNEKKITDYKPAINYLHELIATSKFNDSYNADQWWDISSEALVVLRKQQISLWKSVDMRMKQIYQKEVKSKNTTFFFLIVAILCVIMFVAYSISHITELLRELKMAARKIAKGATGIELNNMPHGVIENLAKSIRQIDKNNLVLATAANEIGKGNFDVNVNPRSEEDLLGISIEKMKNNLADFTAQKDRIQRETLELVNKRDEFFSVASHELKTPLTSLKAYTQLLLMDDSDTADNRQKMMLEKMNVQINKLNSLINDLLDTSKLQNGELLFFKKPCNYNELVSEVAEGIKTSYPEHEIIIQHNPIAEVYADHDRIAQVLNSILMNAVRFSRNDKRIIIDTVVNDDKLVCSVQDFGTGISADEQSKIFDRFYRISGNNLHTYPGLGLGLYISKEIIESHNGIIWIKSEPGSGSTFYFELPLHKQNPTGNAIA